MRCVCDTKDVREMQDMIAIHSTYVYIGFLCWYKYLFLTTRHRWCAVLWSTHIVSRDIILWPVVYVLKRRATLFFVVYFKYYYFELEVGQWKWEPLCIGAHCTYFDLGRKIDVSNYTSFLLLLESDKRKERLEIAFFCIFYKVRKILFHKIRSTR